MKYITTLVNKIQTLVEKVEDTEVTIAFLEKGCTDYLKPASKPKKEFKKESFWEKMERYQTNITFAESNLPDYMEDRKK